MISSPPFFIGAMLLNDPVLGGGRSVWRLVSE